MRPALSRCDACGGDFAREQTIEFFNHSFASESRRTVLCTGPESCHADLVLADHERQRKKRGLKRRRPIAPPRDI